MDRYLPVMRFGHIPITGRKIVIHGIPEAGNILDSLKKGDVLFFDDCLHTQYRFVMENRETLLSNMTVMVFGLSTSLIREEGDSPRDDLSSATFHEMFHRGDMAAKHGFMTLGELKEVLSLDNAYLACHGDLHIDFRYSPKGSWQKNLLDFRGDVECSLKTMKDLGLPKTDIFVYPYAVELPMSRTMLKSMGFRYFFAGSDSKRIPIEYITHGFGENRE